MTPCRVCGVGSGAKLVYRGKAVFSRHPPHQEENLRMGWNFRKYRGI
jgi:hypothetical protein